MTSNHLEHIFANASNLQMHQESCWWSAWMRLRERRRDPEYLLLFKNTPPLIAIDKDCIKSQVVKTDNTDGGKHDPSNQNITRAPLQEHLWS